LLGAANPKFGRFDEFASISDQINMPPALLSRFEGRIVDGTPFSGEPEKI